MMKNGVMPIEPHIKPGCSIFFPSEIEKGDFLAFGRPDIGQREIQAVANVMRSGWLSTGSVVREFEQEFEKFMGTGYAVAVSSCTDGLAIALMAAGVGPGDEVITTPLTFAATLNAILSVGALPILCEVDEAGQIDAQRIESLINENTRAVIPVHYTGESPDMDAIIRIAKKRSLKVIEDAAHSFGGTYNGKPQGTLGDFGVFSFYPTKNITSIEGGMVMCKTADMSEKVRIISMNGLNANAHRRYSSGPIQKYEVSMPGRKANMADVNAAVGLTQLKRWVSELRPNRDNIWAVYEEAFGASLKEHSHHLFTIEHSERDALRSYLHKHGIGTGVHFNPLHLEPAYEFLGYKPGDFPNAEDIGAHTLSLPVSATMTVKDAERVVHFVNEYGEGK